MDCCTIIPMKVHCDKWNIDLPILVTYRYNDPANPYSAVFQSAKCPIVENSKLPANEQSEEYKWMICNDFCDCVHLHNAPPKIEETRITNWL